MPITGLTNATARSCARLSKTISVHMMVTEKVRKLSHGHPPTAKAAMLMPTARMKSAGICTRVVDMA